MRKRSKCDCCIKLERPIALGESLVSTSPSNVGFQSKRSFRNIFSYRTETFLKVAHLHPAGKYLNLL